MSTSGVNPVSAGGRSATFKDPFGLQWPIATHVGDVLPEKIARRQDAMDKGERC